MRLKHWFCCWLLLASLLSARGWAQQIQPLQLTTQLIPPYSLSLADYASAGNEKIRLVVLQRDLSRPLYQIRLQLRVELNGKTILQTSRSFQPQPITLEAGSPTILMGADLAAYVDSRNLDFIGIDRTQYERTKTLPEGSYTFCFTAYDYRRQEVAVSNAGCAMYFLSKNEPPLINTPACGSRVSARNPQQIIFSWMPRNTASPTSAAGTEYEFELYENRIKGRNANNVVQTCRPIYTTRTDFTQLVYGASEPMLIDSMDYIWRVRAIDKDGKDAFRNNGYSEVCSFTYRQTSEYFTLGTVANFTVQAQTHKRARMSWTADPGQFDSYRIEYQKKGAPGQDEGYEWFRIDEKDSAYVNVFDLAANTEYQARIQGEKQGFYGPYSPLVVFKTPEPRVIQCGQPDDQTTQAKGNPALNLLVRQTITARSLEITLTQVKQSGGDGYYSGQGRVAVPFLAGASFGVEFDGIYVNEDHQVTQGKIYFLTTPIGEWIEQTLAWQEAKDSANTRAKLQAQNQEKYADYEFDKQIVLYDKTVIAAIAMASDGTVTITDEKGNAYTARSKEIPAQVDKPLIIEDKNGDQWIVQSGKDPIQVPGGGLPGKESFSKKWGNAWALLKESVDELTLSYTAQADSQQVFLKDSLYREEEVVSSAEFAESEVESYVSTQITYDSVLVVSQPALAEYIQNKKQVEKLVTHWFSDYYKSQQCKQMQTASLLDKLGDRLIQTGWNVLQEYKDKQLSNQQKAEAKQQIKQQIDKLLAGDFIVFFYK